MQYEAPTTIDQAVALLNDAGQSSWILAGGTDLLVQLRAGIIEPKLIVDIKKIAEVRSIQQEDAGYRVGAAVTGAELGEHEALKRAWPGVVEAVELIGSTQIQGRASLGGNLCNASPAADAVPALVAAGAICTIAGPTGRRELPVEAVCTGPGQTSLRSGEFVVSFWLSTPRVGSSDAYLRFIPRTEMDIAVVGAGIRISLDSEGICEEARVAVGAVAPTVLLVADAATALVGTTVDTVAIEQMVDAVRASCDPIDDKRGTVTYRTQVAGVLARRACRIALQRARRER